MGRYDRALSQFSPDGRIFQVEYAQLASERGSPVIFCSDGKIISVAIEKRTDSKNRILSDQDKLKEVEDGIYLSFAGISPDSMQIIDEAVHISRRYSLTHGEKIDIRKLSLELGDYMQKYTITGGYRPFGVKIVLFGFDRTGPVISIVEPDGNYAMYSAGAIGQKSSKAVEELETSRERNPTALVTRVLYNIAQKDPRKMTVYEIDEEKAKYLPISAISEIISNFS